MPLNFLCHHQHSTSTFPSHTKTLLSPQSMVAAADEWVKAAMMNDAMVVKLLLRLHRKPPAVFPLEWSVRQRRSKPVPISNNLNKKPAYSQRASPTTPLSWSGATSEESSRPRAPTAARSKVNINGEKAISKRSRKKKTLAELKEEEGSLLKERRRLKREMEALRMNLEKQRATNENLKKMKIEFRNSPESTSAAEESISGQFHQESTACQPTTSDKDNADAVSDSEFFLPDLNIPFDEPSPRCIGGVGVLG